MGGNHGRWRNVFIAAASSAAVLAAAATGQATAEASGCTDGRRVAQGHGFVVLRSEGGTIAACEKATGRRAGLREDEQIEDGRRLLVRSTRAGVAIATEARVVFLDLRRGVVASEDLASRVSKLAVDSAGRVAWISGSKPRELHVRDALGARLVQRHSKLRSLRISGGVLRWRAGKRARRARLAAAETAAGCRPYAGQKRVSAGAHLAVLRSGRGELVCDMASGRLLPRPSDLDCGAFRGQPAEGGAVWLDVSPCAVAVLDPRRQRNTWFHAEDGEIVQHALADAQGRSVIVTRRGGMDAIRASAISGAPPSLVRAGGPIVHAIALDGVNIRWMDAEAGGSALLPDVAGCDLPLGFHEVQVFGASVAGRVTTARDELAYETASSGRTLFVDCAAPDRQLALGSWHRSWDGSDGDLGETESWGGQRVVLASGNVRYLLVAEERGSTSGSGRYSDFYPPAISAWDVELASVAPVLPVGAFRYSIGDGGELAWIQRDPQGDRSILVTGNPGSPVVLAEHSANDPVADVRIVAGEVRWTQSGVERSAPAQRPGYQPA